MVGPDDGLVKNWYEICVEALNCPKIKALNESLPNPSSALISQGALQAAASVWIA